MDTLIRPLALLPTVDWLALLFFFGAWVGYATFAKRLAAVRPSILVSTNQWRRRWMLQATYRDHLEPAAVQFWRHHGGRRTRSAAVHRGGPAPGLCQPRRPGDGRLAAETFNHGLRAYYLAFAAICWFFSAWAFIAGTVGVIWVLYRREFHSEVLVALRSGLDGQ